MITLTQLVDPPTFIVPLTGEPEAGVEVSQHVLVLSSLPDVVNSIGQLPLSDLSQLFSSGWRQCAVEGVLSGTLFKDKRREYCKKIF